MKVKKEKPKDLKRETKKRLARMRKEFNGKLDLKVFENTEGYDQMIAQVSIPVAALCEHHGVQFTGTANVAYIPGDSLIGLSKLARIAERHMNITQRTIQEKATHRIMKDIVEALNPKGAMVIVKARHSCISDRGVRKPSLTITSSVYGVFAHDVGAKQEFLSLVNNAE